MATVKTPPNEINGVPRDTFETQHKPLYHAVLGMSNHEWERLREKASQKAGNKASRFFDDIIENKDPHTGRRKVFDLISKFNSPRIAARMLERVPAIHQETGGNLADQLHQLIEPDKFPKI